MRISREGVLLAGAFAMIAVAFVFLTDLSISINDSQLILTPDFVAFILFAIAASRLRHIDPRVRIVPLLATVFAIITAIEWLAALAGARPSFSFAGPGVQFQMESTPWILVNLVVLIGTVVTVWLICGAIAAFAARENDWRLVAMAKSRRLLYAILLVSITVVAYTLAGFMAIGGVVPVPIFVVLWTIAFVAAITMLVLLVHLALCARRLASGLHPAQPLETPAPGGPGESTPPRPGSASNTGAPLDATE